MTPRDGGAVTGAAAVRRALAPVIAASTHWLIRAYPAVASGDRIAPVLHELQARQAITAAAGLRYPTPIDAHLVVLAGPGGSALLDWRTGDEPADPAGEDEGWRTWVDEVVVSWAACLLANPLLAGLAVEQKPAGLGAEHFRRLTGPDEREALSAAILRHPDLLEPVAGLHRTALLNLLADRVRDGAR